MFRKNTSESSFIRAGVFLLLTVLSLFLSAQTRQDLEKQKRENLQRIAEAQRILTETESERKATLGQLQAIQNQIKQRTSLIASIKSEIGFLNDEISDLGIIVQAMENDLVNLKKEYSEMIYAAHKANQGYSTLTFLFSSETFNQLFMRLKYLDQYADARKTQAKQIEIVAAELLDQKDEVEDRKAEQQSLLGEELAENQKLVGLRTKQNSVVQELSSKEGELRAEVEKRRKSNANLDRLIAEIIEREARSATVADVAENASFEEMRTRLKWPVATGFISEKFGKQPHPILENIEIQNNGVRIQTNKGEVARSVSDGTVTTVTNVFGTRAVIVRHGQYLTVYANLAEVKVVKGQVVLRDDPIGTVYTDSDGLTQLEFQMRKGREKLDPEKWLAKK